VTCARRGGVIHKDGKLYAHQCADKPLFSPCIFEYVYFARPDSTMDDVSVHKARMRMGEKLAEKIQREWPDHDIDVVIPIPDTSRTSALQLANMLGVKYREGFIKNRYIGRTFIMPGQKLRNQSVRQKLNAIDLEFHGKNVLLVDDSIVRGPPPSRSCRWPATWVPTRCISPLPHRRLKISQRLWHRHAERQGTHSPRQEPGRGGGVHRRGQAHLPGPG